MLGILTSGLPPVFMWCICYSSIQIPSFPEITTILPHFLANTWIWIQHLHLPHVHAPVCYRLYILDCLSHCWDIFRCSGSISTAIVSTIRCYFLKFLTSQLLQCNFPTTCRRSWSFTRIPPKLINHIVSKNVSYTHRRLFGQQIQVKELSRISFHTLI